MFSDPAYGGNMEMAGWRLVGYPGAKRAYTPEEMMAGGPSRPPQTLAELHAFHPGHGLDPNAILPLSGEDHRGH
jgi:gluconate 2-dehydrogenase gamma chain